MTKTVESRSNTTVNELIDRYRRVRRTTMEIVEPLETEDYVVQTAEFMSPPRWHIGHTTWFFETLLQTHQPGYTVHSEDFLYFFNSYYEGFGRRIERARRGTRSRPTVRETIEYRSRIDAQMEAFIEAIEERPDSSNLKALVRLGLEHEIQHQELLVYDIKHLLCDLYDAPPSVAPPALTKVDGAAEFSGGLFDLGYAGGDFAWDNEKPAHRVWVEPFALDRAPVTNGEYLKFMLDGGYDDWRWWLSTAWESVNREGWRAPLYWEFSDGGWMIRDFHGLHPVEELSDHPVAHVSYYEASAFAKWSGRRLPTEAEWEFAACFDPAAGVRRRFPWGDGPPDRTKANLFDGRLLGTAPVGAFPDGASPAGCHQMIGDAWEWTSSDYAPYPGFKTEFNEYNDKWFVGQKVLRGGSFGTPEDHIRATYRNFFHPHERWMLAGFRCAADL